MSTHSGKPEGPTADVHFRHYLGLLVFTALLGVPISAAAYVFLWTVNTVQEWVMETLPTVLGFEKAPWWWPVPLLIVGGLLAGAAIAYLPGHGGHSPADGFETGAAPKPIELPGVLLAALASLALGAVVGPEAPLIALGSGLAALALWLLKRDAPDAVFALVGGASAFAAISFLLGSPIVGAFLMLEIVGLAGPRAKAVLVPGLLCSGIGFLVAMWLYARTGFGVASGTITNLPRFTYQHVGEFLWAIGFGLGAALAESALRTLALLLRPHVERRPLLMTPLAGLVLALLAIVYSLVTWNSPSDVLFSGEERLSTLIHSARDYKAPACVLLIVCKGLAYSISLSAFRGGPVFPAMFLGAAAGILCHQFAGLALTAGVAMGIGAMTAVMLRMPMTAVLLPSLLLGRPGITAMPLVIVAVVVAYVAVNRGSE
jgi:H+/Cl- antiporter ClcA